MVRACSRQMHCVRVLMHAAGMSDARSCRKAWPRSRKSAPTTSRCVTSGGMTRRRASPSQTSRAQVSRASRSGNRSPSRKSSRVCFPVSPAIYLLFLASSFQLLQRAALRPCRPCEALWAPLKHRWCRCRRSGRCLLLLFGVRGNWPSSRPPRSPASRLLPQQRWELDALAHLLQQDVVIQSVEEMWSS